MTVGSARLRTPGAAGRPAPSWIPNVRADVGFRGGHEDRPCYDAANTWLDAGMQGWTVAYSLAKEMILALDEEWLECEQSMRDEDEENPEPD